MTESTGSAAPAVSFADCIDKITSAGEYLLVYAAEGRASEPPDAGTGSAIRTALVELEYGLLHLTSTSRMLMAELQAPVDALQALEAFSGQLEADAERTQKVLQVVLTAPLLSSVLIDRLSGSVHLRCLLSDIQVLDEVIRMHLRSAPLQQS